MDKGHERGSIEFSLSSGATVNFPLPVGLGWNPGWGPRGEGPGRCDSFNFKAAYFNAKLYASFFK